jgi:hypothetical protein
VNVIQPGSTEESWVSIFSDLRNKKMYVPILNTVSGLFLSIPSSNAFTERVFLLMSNKLLIREIKAA